MNNEIYFVNSFTDEVFSGNPAGVVFHEKKIDINLMHINY